MPPAPTRRWRVGAQSSRGRRAGSRSRPSGCSRGGRGCRPPAESGSAWISRPAPGGAELLARTDLPVVDAAAVPVAERYRRRWTAETMFQAVTSHVGGAGTPGCYPQAAVVACGVALVADSVLAVVRAALRA